MPVTRFVSALSGLVLSLALNAAPEEGIRLLRQPTLSLTHIVFSYAGDLWIVDRAGGEARPLTTGAGVESNPVFSPDGRWVAFTGEYDGNVDVYVVEARGGIPRRLTYHPGVDDVVGWSPDGQRVIFASSRESDTPRYLRLFSMAADGVFPEALPLPMAANGALSPDGKRLAYEPVPRAFQAWKRYRGGRASYLWIADLADSRVEKVPRTDSNDFNAMWMNGKVYFLSDREGPVTLFSYDKGQVKRELPNRGLDLKNAQAGPDAIVYEQFGSIHLFNPATGKAHPVPISVRGDLPGVRARFEKVGNRLMNVSLSPTGARAVFEARGDIFTVPAEKGSVRNLTGTPGVVERDPAWSPDGKWIAYFSEASGEYALHLKGQNGTGDARIFALPPSFYYAPLWSPDNRKIAFFDKRGQLWLLDVDKGKTQVIDSSKRGANFEPAWSPDSRWLAYTRPLQSYYRALFVRDLDKGQNHQLTDGMSDVRHPGFDKGGKYLYFGASTDIGPRVSGFDMTSYPHRPTENLYLAVLKASDPSPLAPESDDEKIAEEAKAKDDAKAEAKANGKADAPEKPSDKAAPAKKEPPKVIIDVEGFSQRILALPVPSREYLTAVPGKEGILFVMEPGSASVSTPDSGPNAGPGFILHSFDLKKRKLDKVMEGLRSFDLSATGEKMLIRQGEAWFIAPAGTAPKPGEGRLRTDEMEMRVDPKAEWAQMYRETWRIERDFFYDPDHHGLDLKAAQRTYQPYLEGLQHRSDLNYLFQEMLGELSVGHLYVGGGDAPNARRVPGGLLGCDFTVNEGRYRFSRIFNGESWNPDLKAPLTQPGVDVKEGEYLLAVQGRELTSRDNVFAALEGTANRQVVLKVGPRADGSGSREVTVMPIASDSALRTYAWIEGNRRKVAQMTQGRVAYLWLPDTAQGGYTYFNRYFFSQLDKEGAVVDERFNGGGSAADYIIEYLKKPLYSHWAVRDGEDFRQPFGTLPGPKAMIVNEFAGSGGDYLPWLFRRETLGPLVGKRTWGGLVGIGGYPQLMDGGFVTAPHFAFYTPEGQWDVENVGVAPDVVVDQDPKAWREGHDPQLEKAVALVMESLKANPTRKVARPPYPNYHR
ncbi:MAG: PDZ domain-containing protein [Firmicutes bacterium]|nr:PDZ domain-containing protein [Bacillota bacterium]